MQIVESIDIEDALREDLGELLPDILVCAPPAPDDLQPGTVCITCIGGQERTQVSDEFDLIIDAWAKTPDAAIGLANRARALIASITYRTPASGRHYKWATCQVAALNPDPARPKLPHASFMASVQIRGKAINL